MLSDDSILTEKYFRPVVSGPKVSICHAYMQPFTTSNSSGHFGAPNGLCSSITRSKHIKAVEEPWRWSSCWNALGQMLTTNARLDKLAAARADFTSCGMLEGSCLSAVLQDLVN